MNLAEIETFLTIVNTKSITRTADLLFLSQPTVSSHICNLEKEPQPGFPASYHRMYRQSECSGFCSAVWPDLKWADQAGSEHRIPSLLRALRAPRWTQHWYRICLPQIALQEHHNRKNLRRKALSGAVRPAIHSGTFRTYRWARSIPGTFLKLGW